MALVAENQGPPQGETDQSDQELARSDAAYPAHKPELGERLEEGLQHLWKSKYFLLPSCQLAGKEIKAKLLS